jgi:hypothetical protein
MNPSSSDGVFETPAAETPTLARGIFLEKNHLSHVI